MNHKINYQNSDVSCIKSFEHKVSNTLKINIYKLKINMNTFTIILNQLLFEFIFNI